MVLGESAGIKVQRHDVVVACLRDLCLHRWGRWFTEARFCRAETAALTVFRLKKSHHFISSVEHSNWDPYLIANFACHFQGFFKVIHSTMQMPFLEWIQLLNTESRFVHQRSGARYSQLRSWRRSCLA